MVTDDIAKWIKEWFDVNGVDCKAVVGVSGGKDSAVTAALCVKALGADRVVGVIMPNVTQPDMDDAWEIIDYLGIKGFVVPITTATADITNAMRYVGISPSMQTTVNLPARIRMSTLYAISQSVGGRVANTCNLSEDVIGYYTRYGDGAGDFAPLANLTCTEVVEIGHLLGLPAHLVDKAPSDGLCGKTDEERFGFTYDVLDRYIRGTAFPDKRTRETIDYLVKRNHFKLLHLPSFEKSSCACFETKKGSNHIESEGSISVPEHAQ